jgi:hypothetical protein
MTLRVWRYIPAATRSSHPSPEPAKAIGPIQQNRPGSATLAGRMATGTATRPCSSRHQDAAPIRLRWSPASAAAHGIVEGLEKISDPTWEIASRSQDSCAQVQAPDDGRFVIRKARSAWVLRIDPGV